MTEIFINDKIEKLNMSTRLHNCLRRIGIDTIEKLLDFPEEEWFRVRNLGAKTIDEAITLVASIKSGGSQYILHNYEYNQEDSDENCNRICVFEKNIDEMDFSNRAFNCLSRAGLTNMSQIVTLTKEDLLNIRNMGVGTVEEILEKTAAFEEEIKNQNINTTNVPNEILHIADECAESYGLSVFKMRNLFASISKDNISAGIEVIINKAYSDEYLRFGAKTKIMDVCTKYDNEFDADYIREKLPFHLSNTMLVEELLLELEDENKIKQKNNFYTVVYPSILEYLEDLEEKRWAEVVLARLHGRTLNDVGEEFGITRERTRQICNKVFNNAKNLRFEEDKYRYLFESYSLDCEDFCKLTLEPETTFFYLDCICDTRDNIKLPADKILSDNKLSIEFKRRAEHIIYKDFIILDGMRVRKNKSDIFGYIVKKHCKEKSTYEDVLSFYYRLLEEKNLTDNPKLVIEPRSYENKLQLCNYALWNRNHSLRYYDITERDYSRLVSKLSLDQYNNITFSSLKLYREHADLMEEYDIRDEYELHNLLKKIWDKWGNCEVEFSKMPTINIGNIDRDKQALELLLKYAPISNFDLAKRYEETYGVLAPTVLSNYFNCLDSYFHNGMYSVEFEPLSNEQREHMSILLSADFYSVDDFWRILKREFPDAKETLVNSYNIKELGFSFNDSYLIRKTHPSASEYFRSKLLESDIVDTRDFPKAMLNSVTYSSEKYDLRSKRIITEFLPGQYINISRLNNVGIHKETLDKYCEEIKHFVPKDTFFTISSIKQDGFDSELHELYFDEWFYSSVLAEDKENFSYIRCGNTRVFYSDQIKFNLSDFIVWLVERETKIEIYDLEELCKNRYGASIDRYKLISIANNSGLYYDEIMETVYVDYETYFEEV